MATKWQKKIGKRLTKHVLETARTLAGFKKNLEFQRGSGCRCWKCEKAAAKLGF